MQLHGAGGMQWQVQKEKAGKGCKMLPGAGSGRKCNRDGDTGMPPSTGQYSCLSPTAPNMVAWPPTCLPSHAHAMPKQKHISEGHHTNTGINYRAVAV